MKTDGTIAVLYLYDDSTRDENKVEFQFSPDVEFLLIRKIKNGMIDKEIRFPTKILFNWNEFQVDLLEKINELVKKTK